MYIPYLLLFCFVDVHAWYNFFTNYKPFSLGVYMITCDHNKNLNLDVSGVNIYFYDFANNIYNVFPAKKSVEGILALPNLDKNKKIYIYVGGFKSPVYGKAARHVKETFKKLSNSYLIIVDHSLYTNEGSEPLRSYQRSVQHVYYIAKQIGQILTELYEGGISPKNIHAIGHSLGSHMLGYSGNIFFKQTNRKIWRITALDPAGPCFSNSLTEDHVKTGSAEYVEVYHCNAGTFGTVYVLGDIDFFANSGATQPNCRTPSVFHIIRSPKADRCNHGECIMIWLASVTDKNRYPAYKKCEENQIYTNNDCWIKTRTKAGFWNPGNATGVYHFSTEDFIF